MKERSSLKSLTDLMYLGEDAIHGSRCVLLQQAGQSCLHQSKIYHILCVVGGLVPFFRTPYSPGQTQDLLRLIRTLN